MGYTDARGRPEVIAQPFIKQGAAFARVIHPGEPAAESDAPDQSEPAER